MILFGCLLAFGAAVAPRLILILAWIFSDRWDVVWQQNIIMPLLGIIFLPYTTIMYLLAWNPAVAGGANIEGWDWMWILMGLFLDIWKWSQIWQNRKEAASQTQRYYPSGAPSYPTSSSGAAISTGQVPPSSSPTAPDYDPALVPPVAEPPAPAAEPEGGAEDDTSGSS